MNIEHGLLAELGIKVESRTSDGNLYFKCPTCGRPKCAITQDTGQYRCWRVSCTLKPGNSWTLLKLFRPNLEPYELMQKLKDLGCADDMLGYGTDQAPGTVRFVDPKQADEEKWQAGLARYQKYVKDKDVRPANETELDVFSKTKGIPKEILKHFKPLTDKHACIALPCTNPGRPESGVCGCIRLQINGKKIRVGKDDEDKWIEKKSAARGTMGLFCEEWVREQSILRPDDPIVYAEGYGDAAKAMEAGFIATACNLGAGKFLPGFGDLFKDRTVWLIQDRDDAGVAAEKKLYGYLQGIALKVVIIHLPYDQKPKEGHDLKDWFTEGGTAEDLRLLAKNSEGQHLPEGVPLPEADTSAVQVQIAPDAEIKLPNNEHRTIAMAYEAQSSVKHHWNEKDGWTIYQNGHYQRVSDKAVQKHLEDFMGRCVWKKSKKWVPTGTSSAPVRSVLGNLSRINGVYLHPNSQAAPCSLDKKLAPDTTIPMSDGLLDWSVWPPELHKPSDQFYSLNHLPFKWEGKKHSEMWDKFLVDCTGGNTELMDLAQMWAGYLLSSERGRQLFMICYGRAGTGKSAFVETIERMLGEHNVSHVNLRDFSDKNALYLTHKARLNVSDEAEGALLKGVENQLKTYVGGGKLTFKALYNDVFDAKPVAKVMVTCDKLPKFEGDLESGTWRRMLILPFNNVVAAKDRILDIDEVFQEKGHMPAILYWALEGARKIKQAHGFKIPAICHEIKREHQKECIPEIAFFQEHFLPCEITNHDINKMNAIPQKLMKQWYSEFIDEEHRGEKAKSRYMSTAREMFPNVREHNFKFASGEGATVWKCWIGLVLKDESAYAMKLAEWRYKESQ